MLAGDISHTALGACANAGHAYIAERQPGIPHGSGPVTGSGGKRRFGRQTFGCRSGKDHCTATVHTLLATCLNAGPLSSKCSASQLDGNLAFPASHPQKSRRSQTGIRRPGQAAGTPKRGALSCQRMSAQWRSDQKRWRIPTVIPVRLRAPLLSSAMPAPPLTRVWSTAKYASVRLESA